MDFFDGGVELVKRMQAGGDMKTSWIIFDHVKCLKDWTRIPCHVYDIKDYKVLPIVCCDMQSENETT